MTPTAHVQALLDGPDAEPVLLSYQRRWVWDEARVKIIEKSRQIGISWATAGAMALDAARARGKDCWYVGYSKEMAKEFIMDAAHWALAFAIGVSEVEESVFEDDDDPDCDVLTYSIRFASGHRITALSSRPRGLRNKRGHVVLDEAAFHDDFAGLLKSARANLIWGGDIWIMSTHNGVTSDFNKLLGEVRAGRLRYSAHRVTLDDAVAAGLCRRICDKEGWAWSPEFEAQWRRDLVADHGDDAPEELFCVPQQSGGTYLSRALVESCMYPAPVYRYEAPAGFAALDDVTRAAEVRDWLDGTVGEHLRRLPVDRWISFGEDFGRTADLTVIPPVILNQNLSKTVPFILELRDVPFREQELALFYVVDGFRRFHFGALDDTGNGQYLAERAWQRYGEQRIERVHLTEKWYGEHLPRMKADFEAKTMAIPRDADVLSDLQALRVIDGVPRLPKTRQKQAAGSRQRRATRHGDAAIGLALGSYASRQPFAEYAYESVEGPRARRGLD